MIIDIDSGGQDKKLEAVQAHVKEKGHPYVTIWDKGDKIVNAYGVKVFPTQYLIGVDGKVLWEGCAEKPEDAKKVEELIQKELEKVSKETLEKIEKESQEK